MVVDAGGVEPGLYGEGDVGRRDREAQSNASALVLTGCE